MVLMVFSILDLQVHLDRFQLLLVRRPCPQYHIEMERVVKTVGKVKVKFEQNRGLFEELTLITGQKTKNFDDVQDIYSTLRAEVSTRLAAINTNERFNCRNPTT